jgi:hypothetical protein
MAKEPLSDRFSEGYDLVHRAITPTHKNALSFFRGAALCALTSGYAVVFAKSGKKAADEWLKSVLEQVDGDLEDIRG